MDNNFPAHLILMIASLLEFDKVSISLHYINHHSNDTSNDRALRRSFFCLFYNPFHFNSPITHISLYSHPIQQCINHKILMTLHSRNRWSWVLSSLLQNTHLVSACIPIFASLSTVRSLRNSASHNLNLFLGCIHGFKMIPFLGTFGNWGERASYIFFIRNFNPLT